MSMQASLGARFSPHASEAPALPPAIRRLAQALDRAPRLPARLRGALLRACTEPRPFLSVSRLAAASDCDRRTLWRDWRRGVGPDAALRLEDVLHWLLLARALALKTPQRSWCDVADEVRVHPHTLGRFARRFTGLPLRQMAGAGALAATVSLERELLPHLEGQPGQRLAAGAEAWPLPLAEPPPVLREL